MNTRRRTTVHDLAALRLHRDGTRVLNSDTNRSSRRAKYATHDSRGNWIAQDAGGLANVKQRRSAHQPENNDGPSEPEENEDAPDGTQPSPSSSKGKGRPREDEDAEDEPGRKPRARKRRRFDEDLGYLASVSTPALASSADIENPDFRVGEQEPEARPVPSSDLLKCLHYFASTYYTSMGQLQDATREFRKQRKARRLEKASAARKGATFNRAQPEGAGPHEATHSSGEEDFELSDDEVDAPVDDPPVAEQGTGTGTRKSRQPRKKGPRQLRPMEKDMYKIFDGSALMALGMLFQEHVAEVLEPRAQDGWEKEMWKGEREERAEARKMRKAKEQWTKRHVVKNGSEEPADAEEVRSDSGKEQRSGGDTDSDEEAELEDEGEDEDERSMRRSVLKQSSSVPVLQSSDDSDE